MTREEAHKLIDELFDMAGREPVVNQENFAPEEPKRVLPEGKKVVRTKSTGDRVYLLDETKKVRQWITNPEVLKSTGFEISDVTEIDDTEMLKYQMGSPMYRPVDEAKV